MRAIGQKTIFALQFTDEKLRLLKIDYRFGHILQNVEIQESLLTRAEDIKKSARLLRRFLVSFGYKHEPVYVLLPRLSVVSRTLLLPETKALEIEQMIALQAPRFLPYPFQELSVGFQILASPQRGYSLVQCSIIPKKELVRYSLLLSAAKVSTYDFFVHSYCVAAYYAMLNPQDKDPVLVIAQDGLEIEIVVIRNGLVFESRAFSIDQAKNNEDVFVTESVKTLEVYRKDTGCVMPAKTVLLLSQKPSELFIERMKNSLGLPVEIGEISDSLQLAGVKRSFSAHVGVIGVAKSLSLLPLEHKRLMAALRKKIELLRVGYVLIFILLVGAMFLNHGIQTKRLHLAMLKKQIVSMVGHELHGKELEKRLKIAEQYAHRQVPVLDFLGGVYGIIPQGVSLKTFIFENESKIILKGESGDLGGVLTFVSVLQQHKTFIGYSVKVKYATAKKNANGDSIDFEIICEKAR